MCIRSVYVSLSTSTLLRKTLPSCSSRDVSLMEVSECQQRPGSSTVAQSRAGKGD